ncbi:FtsW/RodA/SpoVE family cell cycle protein, partial [Arthrobacter sp. Br18]|uniref:FtsW/RodA/SpoVE family cell cycle protein n=1 Tax=Arthrobacter sp. Br18 TaxID=1312954 RepID=UPI00138AE3E6
MTTTLALVAIGLMMVLSASSFELAAQGKSPYGTFHKQIVWVGIGLAVLVVVSRLPLNLLKRSAGLILTGSFLLTLLVFTPLGIEVNGNRNWIGVGPFTVQPSEFLKLSVILWAATVLTRRSRLPRHWKQLAVPVLPASLAAVALVLAGKDLGTAVILALIIAGLFFFAGASLAVFGCGLVVTGLAAFAAVISNP